MTKLPLLLAASFIPAAAAAASGGTAADAKTRLSLELMQVTHFDRTMQSMQAQVRQMMESQLQPLAKCEAAQPLMQEFGGRMADAINANLDSESFRVDVAAVYAETFTEQELAEIIEFYESPLGAKLLARMPALMQKTMQISQDRMRELMPEIEKLGRGYGERLAAACPAAPAQ